MKYIRLLSRVVLGIIFVFSGFVKAVDPLGSAYKFSDYFTAFRIGFLDVAALPLGVGLSAFEMVVGMALILGYRRQVVVHVVIWFMFFFTLLTLVLALFNPVSDCGCFGDALILTNWQTFLKNLVLMLFVLVLFFGRKADQDRGSRAGEWTVIALLFAGACLFSVWNYRHLPLVDFRPYDMGTVIADEMVVPEGSPVDEYETTLEYRNRTTGETETFTIEDYPDDTILWEFVNSESRLVKRGDEPPIHDFAIMDGEGNDLVDQILADPGYSLLMICHDLSKASESALVAATEWSRLERLAGDFSFYPVTASTTASVEAIATSLDLGYSFFAGDEIMLKTIVRSNPGYMMIHNGAIVGKWGYRDFPSLEELDPSVAGLMVNVGTPRDEETALLLEAGIYEEFSFDIIEFGQLVPGLVYERLSTGLESRVILGFVLAVVMLLLCSNLVSPVRS